MPVNIMLSMPLIHSAMFFLKSNIHQTAIIVKVTTCFAMRICMRILGCAISWSNKMRDLYDIHAPKKATNLSLNSDLLKKARDLKVNLSATLEQALRDKLKSVEAEKWKKENKAAIAAYNEFVAENGCIADEYRNF